MLSNRFATLVEEDDPDAAWKHVRDVYVKTAEEVLGRKRRVRGEWISEDSWKRIPEMRLTKKLA